MLLVMSITGDKICQVSNIWPALSTLGLSLKKKKTADPMTKKQILCLTVKFLDPACW